MCKCASFVVTKSKVFWSKTSDSHEEIIKEFNLHEGVNGNNFVRVEVSPEGNNLSLPLKDWEFKVDQDCVPGWFSNDVKKYEKLCSLELKKWAKHKLNFNVQEAFNLIHPFKVKRTKKNTLSKKEIEALVRDWASVGASIRASIRASVGYSVRYSVRDSTVTSVWCSVGASVGASVGDSVWYSVGDSVNGYIGSLFPNVKKWEGLEGKVNPWESIRKLWINGYVPSFDGEVWRIHEGPKVKVVLKIKIP